MIIDLGDKAVRVVKCDMSSDELGDCAEDKLAIPLIRLNRDQKGKLLLDSECHEFLHFLFPFLDEEFIEKAGTYLAKYLIARGWVRKKKL